MTSSFLLIIATYLVITVAIWTLVVLTYGDNSARRQRDLDILHALDDLRREVAELRRKISNHHRLP